MPPLMVAVHFGRALVRRAEMELRLETSSTATRHHLPNGLDVTDLHKTKPVCACAAQRPSNASTSRLGDASESSCPGAPRQRRALPDQVRRMNIPASWKRKGMERYGPLKSACPLECVRACRVCTGCRRDVDRARRQVDFNPSIDVRMVRASRARFPDLLCRCERSLSTAAYRPPRRPIPWAGRAAAVESPAPRGAGPIGPVPRWAGPARSGR